MGRHVSLLPFGVLSCANISRQLDMLYLSLYSVQNAGAVIGKGGKNIKALRTDVSTCLSFPLSPPHPPLIGGWCSYFPPSPIFMGGWGLLLTAKVKIGCGGPF